MYKDYIEKHGEQKISYEKYRQVFEAENIGFSRPSQDERGLNEKFKHHQKQLINNNLIVGPPHIKDSCLICDNHKIHKKNYTEARIAYTHDNTEEEEGPDVLLFAVDMQKVLIIPKMKTKNCCFVSRLVVFNENFAALKTNNNVCVIWHEGISGRQFWEFLPTSSKSKDLCSSHD